jgi:hypothetical protein
MRDSLDVFAADGTATASNEPATTRRPEDFDDTMREVPDWEPQIEGTLASSATLEREVHHLLATPINLSSLTSTPALHTKPFHLDNKARQLGIQPQSLLR